jgi:hypothetical protein
VRTISSESGLGAAAAVLAVGGARLALPQSLELGPRWLHMTIVIVLLVMTAMTYRRDRDELNQILGYVLAGALTIFLVWSLVLLVLAVPAHKESAGTMLRSAVALWASNVLVFAYWYWRLDDGGPSKRHARSGNSSPAFLFPQMTLDDRFDAASWFPTFIDYVFLAFNTSMAFSPTDSPVLSRGAKVLTMTQAVISVTVIVVLAARAVNIF